MLAQCNLSKTDQEVKSISRCYVRARDMWRNAIVKIDELSAGMEETYDNLDDGIQAVEESKEDNKDFICQWRQRMKMEGA